MFHDIKLDDKSFQEIKDEAIKHISDHCPEWTNHNISDPGITLVELFSYMTELTQFRLNQVPQKNYLAFLDLLGIKQRLAIAANSRVQFELSTGYQAGEESKDTVFVKKGSVLSSEGDEENEQLTYETIKDLYLSNIQLLNIYTKGFDKERQKSKVFDYTNNINEQKTFFPFSAESISDNRSEIYLFCEEFNVLQNDVKMSILFRLPTSMRTYQVSDDFLRMMQWEYYDGLNWQRLNIAHDVGIVIDDADADVISVTFTGNNENFSKGSLSKFSQDEHYYLRAILHESPQWLPNFSSYEVSIITNSNEEGILPQSCFHNYEQLDMNNNFYPFGTHPTLSDGMIDELFYLQCDQAFITAETKVIIGFTHSTNAAYVMPKEYENLHIVWEYALDNNKWNQLDVKDTTSAFTQYGTISFNVPKDFAQVVVNAEEGYWIRAKIVNGNYGHDEISEYDATTGEVKITPATLNPPILSSINIKYSLPRHDIDDCYVFNNYKYERVVFEKNKPVYFFKQDQESKEALYLAFDSYLSEQELVIYFDIANTSEINAMPGQRVLQWEILQNSKWIPLNITDETNGLSISGDITLKLPKIESLEKHTLYIDSFERMWIRVSVLFNSMQTFPMINTILLNTVGVKQVRTFYDESIGYSNGLPDMKFQLDNKNLNVAPQVVIDKEEYIPVERFIDYKKDDKVFRFNGITGEIQFGDGIYGNIPNLGSEIIVKKYSITAGKQGNLPAKKINVLQESINYIDSVTNIVSCVGGQDGDTIDELKHFAPSVLKTMQRAVSAQDYENLSYQYSRYIKKAKCVVQNGEIIILIMNQNILADKGFINPLFMRELQTYLEDLSMITVKPKVQNIIVSSVTVKFRIKYSDEDNHPIQALLEKELFSNIQSYFDPFYGFKGDGYPIGRRISKNDFQSILTSFNPSLILSELQIYKNESKDSITFCELAYNEIVNIKNITIEELSYDF